jgi:hypothetical protein
VIVDGAVGSEGDVGARIDAAQNTFSVPGFFRCQALGF